MLEPEKLVELGQEFDSAYSTWTASRETGMDPLFIRIQLRKLATLVQQLESLDGTDHDHVVDGLWTRITEVKSAVEQMHTVQLADQDSRQLSECLSEIPELMLLEIDQLLGTQITPEMLSGFDWTEEE